MMEGLLTLLLIISYTQMVHNLPFEKCFEGGTVIKNVVKETGIGSACIKDDVSILKLESKPHSNTSGIYSTNTVTRKWLVSNWEECNPRRIESGNINVIEVFDDMTIHSHTYACTSQCQIGMDKDNGLVVLTTDRINRFEILGTTRKNGWFKSKTSVALDQTCEHLKVTCGTNSVQIHACFKHHMSCIRFFSHTILPSIMVNSICENVEIIILLTFSLLIFLLLIIIMKTYICYLMLPIYIPVAYIYGFIYNKTTKKCISCGLAYHPFTKCSNHCVCGSLFETSDRMRLHRESGMCPGYKSMRTARVLCKSKGSASILSLFVSALILSFVTPINSYMIRKPVQITNNSLDIYDRYLLYKDNSDFLANYINMNFAVNIAILPILLMIYIGLLYIRHIFYSFWVIDCKECDMFHAKENLKRIGNFTNRCNTYTCGFTIYNLQYNTEVSHHKTGRCLYKYESKYVRKILLTIVIIYLLKDMGLNVAAETFKNCEAKTKLELNCLGPLRTIDCSSGEKSKPLKTIVNELISDKSLLEIEKDWALSIPDDVYQGFNFVQNQKTYHSMLVAEEILLRRHCAYFTNLNTPSGDNQYPWRLVFHTSTINFCISHPEKKPCPCLNSKTQCDQFVSNESKLRSYYDTYTEKLSPDLNTLVNVLTTAFPGTTTRIISDKIRAKAYSELKNILQGLEVKVAKNELLKQIVTTLKFACDITLTNYKPSGKWYLQPLQEATAILTTRARGSQVSQDIKTAKIGKETNICEQLKMVHCISPRAIDVHITQVICTKQGSKYLYEIGTNKIYKKNLSRTDYCIKDVHCIANFTPSTNERLEVLKRMTCGTDDPTGTQDEYTVPKRFCRFKNKGSCFYGPEYWTTALCEDGAYYYIDQSGMHAKDKDVGVMCFSDDCTEDRYPVNPENLKNCKWDYDYIISQHTKHLVHNTLESYKKALTESLQHSLELHSYKPTKDLPHIKPSFKTILAQGIETDEGIESSYVEFEIPALSGESLGLSINSPQGDQIFDAIVYVRKAIFRSTYNHIYSTGPTIAMNLIHDEHCTGPCPEVIEKKPNWMTFSQERTSRWGCEEWLCAAINTGCVFGSCQDVIKEELRIYKKSTTEVGNLDICITFADNSYCIELDALNPVVTDVFDIQFKTVESYMLPNILAVKDHNIYTGTINDIGSLNKGCGNVQKRNGTTLGSGDPKFDYVCHAASRKDVIVRKCYDNHYDACRFLERSKTLQFLDKHDTISVMDSTKILGSVKAKVKLGDIKYKLAKFDPAVEYTISCTGCTNCLENVICNIKSDLEVEQLCTITSNCKPFLTRILFKPGVSSYNIKMICNTGTETITVNICNKEHKTELYKIPGSTNLEIKGIDQTAYIREEDNKCGTWLCKVYNEGLTGLLEPLWDWIGEAGQICLYVALGFGLMIITIFVLRPIAGLLISILKKNELEYALEQMKKK
uniref:Envelopment polyprotein n=1 Tax=Nyando virus TaxID=35316 RepID=A0A088MFC3_9VIRU|nr:glycoprotein precursor [Nyando virus]